jgi:hypothetical protein
MLVRYLTCVLAVLPAMAGSTAALLAQSQILVLRTVTSPRASIRFVKTTRHSSTGAGMPTTLRW